VEATAGGKVSILDLAEIVARVVGYQGMIAFDATKPDGTPRKLIDSSRFAALGWVPEISLQEGIRAACRWYLENNIAAAARLIARRGIGSRAASRTRVWRIASRRSARSVNRCAALPHRWACSKWHEGRVRCNRHATK
jgi:hypothetical protein